VSDDIFTPRGISDDVREARRYARYEKGDRDAVLEADPRLARFPDWLTAALREPGWAMPKHAVMPGLRGSRYAEARSRSFAPTRPCSWSPHTATITRECTIAAKVAAAAFGSTRPSSWSRWPAEAGSTP
jgi:hypothetical protein